MPTSPEPPAPSDGSFGGHLASTAPFVPVALAGPRAWRAWEGVTLPLPPCLGQLAWECRLGHDDEAVDLQVGVGEDLISRARLRTLGAPPPGWEATYFLLSTWAEGAWQGLVDAVFLEVDMPRGGAVLPGMLFPRLASMPRDAWSAAAHLLLTVLSDGAVPPAFLNRLEQLIDALPEGADPRYVAWLGARGAPTGRWIGSVPTGALGAFLVRIGWPGDAARVAEEVQRINPWSGQVPIGVDFTDVVGPSLGVELYWAGGASEEPRRREALGRLSSWPELAPARLASAGAWARGEGVPVSLRPELQVKLGWNGGRRSAKAYLGAWTSPLQAAESPGSDEVGGVQPGDR